jgi:3-oxoacyl-[acyl-carrier protein] reductase
MATTATAVAPRATYPDLAGKVAVVTGGSRGIGAATALALGANGVSVALVGRDQGALGRAAKAVAALGIKAIGVIADCTAEEQLVELRSTVNEQLGAVDILVAFAGGNGMPVATANETGEHWRDVIETDLTSTFLTVSEFLPEMLACHSGVIVTMASAAARQAAKSSAAYAAAKAGVVAFSRHLAGEYAHEGIRINCIAPSAIENDKMRAWMTAEQRRELGAAFPLRRIGQPEDVAAATLFFASSASSWITGAAHDIAGGKVML